MTVGVHPLAGFDKVLHYKVPESMRAGLQGVSWSGSTLRTGLDQPFPDDVLREVVLARAQQNTTGT